MTVFLSVIIPAFNEQDNLDRGALTAVYDFLHAQDYTWELIVVNDGSSDTTAGYLDQFAAHHAHTRIIHSPHMGKQATVITGAMAAAGQIILFSDMDQATPITEFTKFLPRFSAGAALVIGSRAGRPNAPIFRKVLALGMVILRTLILRLPVKDSQCGFKAFTSPAAHKIFAIMQRIHPPKEVVGPAVDPGFDVELLYLARKLKFPIVEVPVAWRHQETRRVSFVKDAIAGLTGLLLVRWRSLTNAYRLPSQSQAPTPL